MKPDYTIAADGVVIAQVEHHDISPQMKRLLIRYDVANEYELKRAIQREYKRETGTHFSLRVVDAFLDQMLEAEYNIMGGGE